MKINNIDIPKEIVSFHEENSLVVFAGAGISMANPTNLPSFYNLTSEISKNTEITFECNKVSPENYLGLLKYKGIDVNKEAAEILSRDNIKCNELHKDIIRLFSENNVRIITTNYDLMFEQAFNKMNKKVNIYSSPTLPRGFDFTGLVHIHGDINNPKDMVLTDEDLGRTYLNYGYNSTFVKEVFENYNVIFIGYSYNDVILKYLTASMRRDTKHKRYIFIGSDGIDNFENLTSLGLNLIVYPNDEKNHINLPPIINKLANSLNRKYKDLDSHLRQYSNNPSDLFIEEELEFFLYSEEMVKLFANRIHGEEWFLKLESYGIFRNLFLNNIILNETDIIWAKWIQKEIIGIKNELFKEILYKNNSVINLVFASMLINYISTSEDDFIYKNSDLILFLEIYEKNQYNYLMLIQALIKYNDKVDVCYLLFKHLFDIKTFIKKDLKYKNNEFVTAYKYGLIFDSDDYVLKETWNLCKEKFFVNYLYEVLYFCKNKIYDLYFTNKIFDEKDVLNDLEICGFKSYKSNINIENVHLEVLCDIFCECINKISKTNTDFVISFLDQCINCESKVIKKIAIIALNNTKNIKSNIKFDMIKKHDILFSPLFKEQIFNIMKDIYQNLSKNRKKEFIKMIKNVDISNEESCNCYYRYNWCQWFKNNGIYIDEFILLEKQIKEKYDYFVPRENPEIDIIIKDDIAISEPKQISKDDLFKLSYYELMNLFYYEYDDIKNTFKICVNNNYTWIKGFIKYLIKHKNNNDNIWYSIIISLKESNYTFDNILKLVKLFDLKYIENKIYLLNLLDSLVCENRFINVSPKITRDIIKVLNDAFNSREKINQKFERTIDYEYNTSIGLIVKICCNLIYKYNKNDISEILELLDRSIRTDGKEKEIVYFVLCSNINTLCDFDYDWVLRNLKPILNDSIQNAYSYSWEGICYSSLNFDGNSKELIMDVYLKTLKNINAINKRYKNKYIDLSVILILNYFDKDNIINIITKLYKSFDKNEINHFLSMIMKISELNDYKINEIWDLWLSDFLDIRIKNKPVILDKEEVSKLYLLAVKVKPKFLEIISKLSKTHLPQKLDKTFIKEICKIAHLYPDEVIELLKNMIDGNVDFNNQLNMIVDLYNNVKNNIKDNIKESFCEIAIKHSIDINQQD